MGFETKCLPTIFRTEPIVPGPKRISFSSVVAAKSQSASAPVTPTKVVSEIQGQVSAQVEVKETEVKLKSEGQDKVSSTPTSSAADLEVKVSDDFEQDIKIGKGKGKAVEENPPADYAQSHNGNGNGYDNDAEGSIDEAWTEAAPRKRGGKKHYPYASGSGYGKETPPKANGHGHGHYNGNGYYNNKGSESKPTIYEKAPTSGVRDLDPRPCHTHYLCECPFFPFVESTGLNLN